MDENLAEALDQGIQVSQGSGLRPGNSLLRYTAGNKLPTRSASSSLVCGRKQKNMWISSYIMLNSLYIAICVSSITFPFPEISDSTQVEFNARRY